MKSVLGYGLIIVGIISFFRFLGANEGVNLPEIGGVIIGVGLLTFLPGILLIRSANKNKTNSNEN
jgi:hypothetical protein